MLYVESSCRRHGGVEGHNSVFKWDDAPLRYASEFIPIRSRIGKPEYVGCWLSNPLASSDLVEPNQ